MAHILIVDNSNTEVKFVKKILQEHGHQTSEASTGDEGMQKAKELHPDLIIMDVIMHGKTNGYQATRQITSNPETKSIPIVIVSSLKTENDRVWGDMMGAKGYLGKPFQPNELLEEINKQLDKPNPFGKVFK
jgi:twitching motility two-component system response regulator PilH